MIAPPLDASADDVVAWLFGAGHLSALDEDDRPLGEQASPLYDARRDERRTFGDSRDATELPCNVDALAQVRRVWPSVLSSLSGLAIDRPPTMQRLLYRAQASSCYAKLCALYTPDRPLSREASSLYKVTIGFSELLTTLHLDETVDADAPHCDEERLFPWVEARGFLLGERQVCAGSRAQIKSVWRALREQGEAWAPAWLGPALDAANELSALLATAAGAARAFTLAGRIGELAEYGRAGPDEPVCARLFFADEVPRACAALRAVENAGAMHPTLLYPAAEVPGALRAFLEALPDASASAAPLAATDALLLRHAEPVTDQLLRALDRTGAPLTLEGLRRTCA